MNSDGVELEAGRPVLVIDDSPDPPPVIMLSGEGNEEAACLYLRRKQGDNCFNRSGIDGFISRSCLPKASRAAVDKYARPKRDI